MLHKPSILTHLGNLSASRTTHLTPSRAKTEALYEPPGPPPITNTVVSVGIAMMTCCKSVNGGCNQDQECNEHKKCILVSCWITVCLYLMVLLCGECLSGEYQNSTSRFFG